MSPESGPSDDEGADESAVDSSSASQKDNLHPSEDGRREYGEQEFFDAIKQIENPTTGDIADQVGCSRQAALYRLNNMEEEGTVSSMMIGRAKVWSINE